MAIGLNVAVKGIAFFRVWMQNLYQRVFRASYSRFVNVLDISVTMGPAAAIQKQINCVERTSEELFRWFNVISWGCIIYGLAALYFDIKHCSHLLLLLVWPLYVVVIWGSAKLRGYWVFWKLSHWDEINKLASITPDIQSEIQKLKQSIGEGNNNGDK
jgi:hypothetical protein